MLQRVMRRKGGMLERSCVIVKGAVVERGYVQRGCDVRGSLVLYKKEAMLERVLCSRDSSIRDCCYDERSYVRDLCWMGLCQGESPVLQGPALEKGQCYQR